MKNLSMLVWMTQLGLSVVVPPAAFILLAVWLRDQCNWGSWVLWVGIFLGVYGAVTGFLSALRTMERLSKDKKQEEPPISYNDHE